MEELKLNFLHVCDQVLISNDGGKASIINIFNKIGTEGFPSIIPKFAIIANVSGGEGKHIQKIEIVSPDNKIIASLTREITLKKDATNNFIANFINLAFPMDGNYWLKVEVDNILLTKKDENFISIEKVN